MSYSNQHVNWSPSQRAVHVDLHRPSAVTVTGLAQKRAWAEKSFPPVEELESGIWSIPVPIPGSPLRYVLSYAISTPLGPVIVDPGWPGEAGWTALTDGLAEGGWDIEDVHGVLVTHAHTDHQGQSSRVREVSGCWIGMHDADARILRGYADGSLVESCNLDWLVTSGVPDSEREHGIEMDAARMRLACDMIPDRLIADNDEGFIPGRSIAAIWTPGHTPGHLCFALPDDDVLLGGDHLLPRISSHVGGYTVDGSDALGDYLRSLTDLASRDGDPEVLPGHEYRFRGVDRRVRTAIEHHADRLVQVYDAVTTMAAGTTWDVASRVSWSRGWGETVGPLRRLALAETAAHLRWLSVRGILIERSGRPTVWSIHDSANGEVERIRKALESEYVTA